MDLTVISEYKTGEINFKSKALTKCTEKLIKNMNTSKDAFCRAGLELKKIRDEKLYADDFIDQHGKPSFNNYCELVLGISKSKASRMIVTASRLLAPELITNETPQYFASFGDTSLTIIAEAGENYEECKDFCIEYEISETTPQKDIRAAVKDYRNKKSGKVATNENNEVEENSIEEEDSGEDDLTINLQSEIGDMFRENLNELLEMFPNYDGVIRLVAKEWK